MQGKYFEAMLISCLSSNICLLVSTYIDNSCLKTLLLGVCLMVMSYFHQCFHQSSLHLFVYLFIFVSLAFRVKSTKTSLRPESRSLAPKFSSVCYLVSVLYSNLQSILSYFLCVVYGSGLVSFFCMWLSSFPNTIY